MHAPSPFFATPDDRIAWARQRYFDDGERPTGLVSDTVLQGWQRCLSAGLTPQRQPDFEPVTRATVSTALARSHTLLQAAAPELAQLDHLLSGTGCKLLFTDHRGVVLQASAVDASVRSPLTLGARVGVRFDEGNLGSTAPSVVARSGQACTVLGGEHFLGLLSRVHCAAAPVHNRRGEVAAVLDVSIEDRPFAFDAFGLVRLFAAAIENRYVAAQSCERLQVAFQLAPTLLGTALQGLAVVEHDGRIAWVNPAGRSLLDPPGPADAAAPRTVHAALGLTLAQLQALSRDTEPVSHRLPSGLAVWLSVTEPGQRRAARAAAAAALRPAQPSDAVSLQAVHREHIQATLAACGGNISKAARRLGVSRGLLYRRLRDGPTD